MSWQDRDWAQEEPAHTQYHAMSIRPRSSFSIVTTLIWLNMGIFAIGMFLPGIYEYIYRFGAMQTLAVVHGQLWRLVTSQYLHAGIMHLMVNMVALHFLGRPLEERWSARRFFTIYTMCGVAGNVFYAVLGSRGVIHPAMPAVGASGSIYGLLGIVAVMFPKAELWVWFLFPIPIRWAAIAMGVIAFMTVIERGGNYGGHACHLAGLAFGVWWALHGNAWWQNTEWAWSKRRDKPPDS